MTKSLHAGRTLAVALAFVALALWLRAPGFGHRLWNLDEAIHAAAAGVILDGGVLYRDAIDQRTPLSYYVVAGIFAVAGENNLGAVRAVIAGLVGLTAFLLGRIGQRQGGLVAGAAAGLLYITVTLGTLSVADAHAANTEWFVAFFSAAAAAVFLGGGPAPGRLRLLGCGAFLGLGFLSKQPALLELAAPLAVLLHRGWRGESPPRAIIGQAATVLAGWTLPVALAAGYFAAHGALGDAMFYAWTYNVDFYGPEIPAGPRLGSGLVPFQLLAKTQVVLLLAWASGAAITGHRLLQRTPRPREEAGNPALLHVAVWTLAALAATASGGRGFDHYSIQFLAPFCLGGGLALGAAWNWASVNTPRRLLVGVLLALIALQTTLSLRPARSAPPASREQVTYVADYIRENSAPTDRVFAWGYQPELYLFSARRPASRFLYASFLTGLVPWSNVAPHVDTAYAIVPGAMAVLLQELTAQPPRYIVDCSAGPNRYWDKYPLEKFPELHAFVRTHYRQVEPHVFVPRGYRLHRRVDGIEPAGETGAIPAARLEGFGLRRLAAPLAPEAGIAPHGADASLIEGRRDFFLHAPSQLAYRLPAGAGTLRGGFGLRPGAYAADNPGPTDGAEFIVRWQPDRGEARILFRRLLRPREEPADRGLQFFEIGLPPTEAGRLELLIEPGPLGSAASDWTFWTDLILENPAAP